jgi:hypothetical protein
MRPIQLVLVPCYHVGVGTGTAAVLDCVTRQPVRLRAGELTLVDGTLCVRGQVLKELGNRVQVRFDGGEAAWVRTPVAGGSAA